MKGIGKIIRLMVMVGMLTKLEGCMKVIGNKTNNMVRE